MVRARLLLSSCWLVLHTACGEPIEAADLGDGTGTAGATTVGVEPGSDDGPAAPDSSDGAPVPDSTTTGASTGDADPTTTGPTDTGSSTGVEVTCAQVRVMVAPGADLNVRPAPSTAGAAIGALANATIVDVLEEVDGEVIEGNAVWLHVATNDVDGFIAAAHASCAVDECDLFDVPDAPYLMDGLHPDASDALVFLGITTDRVTQTIGDAAASAGTHAQDGTAQEHPYSAATDLRVIGLSEDAIRQYIADLAVAGYAGWYRSPGSDGVPGDWSPHIHAVWVGAPMKLSLRNQVRSWMEGRNGLVSNTLYQFHQWPQCVRDTVWERYLEHNPADG